MTKFFNRVSRKIALLKWKLYTIFHNTNLTTFYLPNSIQIDYPLKSEVGKKLFINEFETDEIEFLKSVILPGDNVLDIGANAGIYSIILSKLLGDEGHVYAFEIGPSEINLFRKNVEKNNSKNVTLLEYAVSDKTGQAKFAISRDGAMNSLAKNDHPNQIIESWLTVNTIRLDDVAQKYNIKHIDLIKMDVEGAEKLVFEGGQDILSKWKPRYILFESSNLTANAFGYSVSEFIDYLFNNKFDVYSLSGSKLIPITSKTVLDINQYNFVAILKNK